MITFNYPMHRNTILVVYYPDISIVVHWQGFGYSHPYQCFGYKSPLNISHLSSIHKLPEFDLPIITTRRQQSLHLRIPADRVHVLRVCLLLCVNQLKRWLVHITHGLVLPEDADGIVSACRHQHAGQRTPVWRKDTFTLKIFLQNTTH